jgi:hypothetical protein
MTPTEWNWPAARQTVSRNALYQPEKAFGLSRGSPAAAEAKAGVSWPFLLGRRRLGEAAKPKWTPWRAPPARFSGRSPEGWLSAQTRKQEKAGKKRYTV